MQRDRMEPFRELLKNPSKAAYDQVLTLLLQETRAERGCLWLERENVFLYQGDEELRRRFPFSRKAVDSVLEKGRSFICFETGQDLRCPPSGSMLMHNVRSCMCAASRDRRGEVLVLAYLDNGMGAGQFSIDDLDFLNGVLSLVPGAVPTEQ